jgi:hypothetical protein
MEEYTVTASGLVNGSYPYEVGSIVQKSETVSEPDDEDRQ